MAVIRFLLTLAILLVAAPAAAQGVDAFTPQGEVARVRQVTARFAEQMVDFGDPRATDPFDIRCSEKGAGRWIDGRNWSYDFERDVPAGVRCEFTLKSGLRSLKGVAVPPGGYAFSTGGPKVVRSYPNRGSTNVREQEPFLLELNVPADEPSVREHVTCRPADGGRSMGVELLSEAERAALERQLRLPEKATLPRIALRCAAPFTPRTRFALVWGRAVAAQSGVSSERDQPLEFVVRPPFTARAGCPTHNAIEGCNPALPVSVSFSWQVPRELAEAVRLRLPDGSTRAADLRNWTGPIVGALAFPGPYPDGAEVVVTLPENMRDADGRPLDNAGEFPARLRIGEPAPHMAFASSFGVVEREPGGLLPVLLQNVEAEVPLRRLRVGGPKAQPADAEIINWIVSTQHIAQPLQSLLRDVPGVEIDSVRKRLGPKPAETALIRFGQPGFYIVELDSPRFASYRKAYPWVRAAVLVTNLAVHFKHGPENSLAWVTRLGDATPVGDAEVAVRDCNARLLWSGRTDADGLARIPVALRFAQCPRFSGYLVAARHGDDMSFTVSQWGYRASLAAPYFYRWPGAGGASTGWALHTVLDRPLYRVGEAVSMRHYARRETLTGLAEPDIGPAIQVIHAGTRKRYDVPAAWDRQGNAENTWTIPPDAKLGTYRIEGVRANQQRTVMGTFRVEEFRLPTMRASIEAGTKQYFNASEVPYRMQLAFLSGGPSQQTVRMRTTLSPRFVRFDGFEEFSFMGAQSYPPPPPRRIGEVQSVELDARGEGAGSVKELPPLDAPADLATDMEFADANGEIQTVTSTVRLWPAALVLGLRTRVPLAAPREVEVRGVALDLDGRVLPDTAVRLRMALRTRTWAENRQHISDEALGEVCAVQTDTYGLFRCTAQPDRSGEIAYTAEARDGAGNLSRTTITRYYAPSPSRVPAWWQTGTQQVELAADRVRYAPQDLARLQLEVPRDRMRVLLTTEREGVVEARVLAFDAGMREVTLPLKGTDAPNIYVSALLVSGRRGSGGETELTDPDKPAYFHAQRELRVTPSSYALRVEVKADREQYRPRERAKVQVRVTLPDARPAAGAEVVLAAVDDALLQLAPNGSWELLDGMLKRRAAQVASSTAVSQVIGLRSLPRESDGSATAAAGASLAAPQAKAKPAAKPTAAGGAGEDDSAAVRELFDTLLLWRGRVRLDERGEAQVEVPLNDSLTAFRIVAIASLGLEQFGTGDVLVRSSTPLQLHAGLPPVVRGGDAVTVAASLRNTGEAAMRVEFSAAARRSANSPDIVAQAGPMVLELRAGETREVTWPLAVPVGEGPLHWLLELRSLGTPDRDAVRVTQRVAAAVPVSVQQASLAQLDQPMSVQVARPAAALPGRGGVNVTLRPRLVGGLEGVKRYMAAYPYGCLEQRLSRAIALRDEAAWRALARLLPAYQDDDGLLRYFPDSIISGSDVLTAYGVSIVHEAGWALPPDVLQRALNGLAAFVEGRLSRTHWSPRQDMEARTLAAAEALARHGRLRPEMIANAYADPNALPTSAVLDWINVLRRVPNFPKRDALAAEAEHILRARLNLQGTTMGFSTERTDYWFWLMASVDQNAVRAVLTVLDAPRWREDVPRMVRGALGRQREGRWLTTPANAWGVLAMEKFSQRFESQPVTGTTRGTLSGRGETHDWTAQPEGVDWRFDWPRTADNVRVEQAGSGRPWVTIESLAAIPLKAPFSSGYRIVKRVTPVEQKVAGSYRRGDVLRVTLEIDAQSDMTWVALADPVPAGATILGRGLGRDSRQLARDEKRAGWLQPTFQEHTFEGLRAYYAFMSKGRHTLEYTVRLGSAGEFALPQTRVEAMYAPEMHGELPNARMTVRN